MKVSQLNLEASYLWDNSVDPYAYEEYIRGISFTFFQSAYYAGKTEGLTIMNSAIEWIANYDGIRDWKDIYQEVVDDFENFYYYGMANLKSKLKELKSSKPGLHYSDENSYQKKIMDNFLNINTTGWASENIKEKAIISLIEPNNYIYFYLNEGIGEINGIHFSGNRSSFVLYSSQKEDITIIPTTPNMLYYYNQDSKQELTLVQEVNSCLKKISPSIFILLSMVQKMLLLLSNF